MRPQVREPQRGDSQMSFASGGDAKPASGEALFVMARRVRRRLGHATAVSELCSLHFASYGCAAPTFGRGCLRMKAAPMRPKVGATPRNCVGGRQTDRRVAPNTNHTFGHGFRPTKFFSFFSEALFGRYRLTSSPQVVGGP
jgi:hypothetical protein